MAAAVATAEAIQAGLGSIDDVARLSLIIKGAIVHDHIIELENRLSLLELKTLSECLFYAEVDFASYERHLTLHRNRAEQDLTNVIKNVEGARSLLGLTADLAEPFGWLRRPRTTRRLRRELKALIASLQDS